MQEIAVRHPAFAGFAYESPGSSTLVIGVKGPDNVVETVRGAVDLLTRKHVIGNGVPVVVRLADYSFLDLDAWRDSVEARLFMLPEVTMLDLDELHYRLIVGVRPTAPRNRVVAVMREAGIPDAAYTFKDWHPVCWGGCLMEMEYDGAPAAGKTAGAL